MKTWQHRALILLWSLVCAACGKGPEPVDDDPTMVRLSLGVALADDPASYAGAAGDHEKMQTLRIVVVRPDGTVEANRYVELTEAVMKYGYEPFEVVGRETKRIYLFANEDDTRLIDGGTPLADTWELFRTIRPGTQFPTERIAALTVGLDGQSQQLVGALPMNECHTVEVGDTDCQRDLFVTRAAVKFTFRIVQRGTAERKLTGLAIEKVAPREYYMPRNAVYDDDRAIVSYDTPALAADAFYRFTLAADKLPVALPPAGDADADAEPVVTVLDPIYLLESRYTDPEAPAGKSPYRIALSLDGHEGLLTGYLDNLPALPRNTHAVVTITIGAGSTLSCTVDVAPYGEVILDPSFGI